MNLIGMKTPRRFQIEYHIVVPLQTSNGANARNSMVEREGETGSRRIRCWVYSG
jgi:hypothetical protein